MPPEGGASPIDSIGPRHGSTSSNFRGDSFAAEYLQFDDDAGPEVVEVEAPARQASVAAGGGGGGRGAAARCCARWCTQATLSNAVTFALLCAGVALKLLDMPPGAADRAASYVLCFGLFGFAGGGTNWLAVKMLFERVPGLYGSGVIPAKHKEIRRSIKTAIMNIFFDKEFLEKYILEQTRVYMSNLNLEMRLQEALESDEMGQIIDEKLYDFSRTPEGLFLAMMSIDTASLKSLVRPFIVSVSSDVAPLLHHLLEPGRFVSVDRIHTEVDRLLTQKLSELSPEMVTQVLEGVIREHLGWLVVWGNIFGGVIGVVVEASGAARFMGSPLHDGSAHGAAP